MSQLSSDSEADASEDRNPVDLLADEFAQRLRQGETPSIEEYVRDHPELTSQIRSVFPAIAKMEKASRQQLSSSGEGRTLEHFKLDLSKIGDFQIVRTLGQGGMGIVYEALQVSLQRYVALKVISPAISNSPKQLERFKREAAAAARLHHTNIVPVYGSGEESGIHYFAMQLIEGIPLNEAVRNIREQQSYEIDSVTSGYLTKTRQSIAAKISNDPTVITEGPDSAQPDQAEPQLENRLPENLAFLNGESKPATSDVDTEQNFLQETQSSRQSSDKQVYWNRVSELVAEIADALDYAHAQGVFHRDIKPSNLLMDQNGTVWITDFGLAKLAESEQEELTRTGDIVGTLRYMAPEQFSGEGDGRSDICSLGLTLFELLVLQPAYTETRSAALMKQKSEQAPPSPRRIDPALPRDLDTIVLKACSLNPRDRYQSAGELRDDLIRFREGRSIAARRVHLAEQVWRWSRRNPMIAALSSLTLILIVGIATIALISNHRIREALREKQSEYARAEIARTSAQNAYADARKQRLLAEENFTLAIRAFEEIMSNIERRGIPHGIAVEVENEVRSFETSLTASDVQVLETLLGFFAEFADKNEADLSYESAFAQRRVGLILQRLGRLIEAENSLEMAIQSISKLSTDKLPVEKNILARMRIFNELAYCANRRGDFDKAETHLTSCQQLFEQQAEPTNEMRLELARSFNVFSSMYTRMGYVVNHNAVRSTISRNTPRGKTTGSNANRKSPQGSASSKNGTRMPQPRNRTKRPTAPVWITIDNLSDEKKKDIRFANNRSIQILTELIQADSQKSEYQLELSRAYQDQVRINRKVKNQREVIKAFDEAKRILESLVKEYPNNPAYRFELADMLCNLQRSSTSALNPSLAARVAKELVEKWPNVSEYQALYANALARSAVQRIQFNVSARRRLEESIQIYRELIQKYPDYYVYKINFIQYLTLLGTHSVQTGDRVLAKQQFDEAQLCLDSFELDDEDNFLIDQILMELQVARKSVE